MLIEMLHRNKIKVTQFQIVSNCQFTSDIRSYFEGLNYQRCLKSHRTFGTTVYFEGFEDGAKIDRMIYNGVEV